MLLFAEILTSKRLLKKTIYSSHPPQTVAAMGMPFLVGVPTKVAQLWFPEHERTLATTVAAMGEDAVLCMLTDSAA